MAHVAIACLFGFEVKEIHVYPFGYCAVIEHLMHEKPIKAILVLVAGPLVHLVFPLLIMLVVKFDFISVSYAHYLNQMNLAVLFFNLLPIEPLDGGKILRLILRLFIGYSNSRKISWGISVFVGCCVFLYAPFSLKIMLIFLGYLLYCELNQFHEDMCEYNYYQRNYLKLQSNHV